MQAEILLTLKLQDKLFADPRRVALLKQIKATGSISQGAKMAGISYKSAWDAINEMNQLADELLVDRATGGKGGGGATLTHYCERLLQLYDLLGQIQQKAFDVLKDDSLPLDSLLAAISRFSLQTSARNQFFGTIIERDHLQVQQHVNVQLADQKTVIRAALTEKSASVAQQYDNALSGTLTQIETGNENSELVVTLEGGLEVCATCSNQHVTQQKLHINDTVTALFNADQVIIATLC
ncbi:TOBE domain-containing protein [Proteus mirabilis]|nr:TOBE domain-containing protein [Proteus mirabilis]